MSCALGPTALEAQAKVLIVRTLNRSDRIIADTMGTPFGMPAPVGRTSLATFVRPNAEDRSTIRTVLLDAASNVTEGAKPTQYCNSNGELERLIHQRLTQKLRM